MSLKYIPPNASSLIISMGVLFGLNSINNTPLSSNTELFRIFTASLLLIHHKIRL